MPPFFLISLQKCVRAACFLHSCYLSESEYPQVTFCICLFRFQLGLGSSLVCLGSSLVCLQLGFAFADNLFVGRIVGSGGGLEHWPGY